MKKFAILFLAAVAGLNLSFAASDEASSGSAAIAPSLPAGAIHHFDFSGDLRDRVTGQPLYISRYTQPSRPDRVAADRLVPDSVQFVDTDEGARTAIRILPLEFAGKLNWVDCPQMTVSMVLRFDGKDFQEKKNNWISWLETIYYDASGQRVNHPREKRDYRTRKIDGEYHTSGVIDATQDDEGLKIPKDEWVRFTVSVDESARRRTVYVQDRFVEVACKQRLDSTLHTGRVGLFQESLPGRIKGYVSDVVIYDRVLSPEEVAQLHGTAEFKKFTVLDAYRPLILLVVVLTIIPVAFWFWKPFRLKRLEAAPAADGSNDARALQAIDRAIDTWMHCTEEQWINSSCATDQLYLRYPRSLKIPKIRKKIVQAMQCAPSDPEVVRRINRVVDSFNDAVSYRFNGSILYIFVVLFSLFFQEAFQGTRTIFTSEDLTFWGAFTDTFVKYWPFMLLLIPYVAFSMGWRLIGHFEEEIKSDDPSGRKGASFRSQVREVANSGAGIVKVILSISWLFVVWCGKTILWGIQNSGEVIRHYRNGVHVSTTTGVNPAMFFGGLLVVAIVIAVIYFLLTYLSIVVMLSPLVVIPYKLVRNYILHR
ncbi:MAG TPA: hypothetical protein H9828_03275 [Candidatus Alistipes intestinigallinarum]|uniref:LamG domain-containing protein n=1 Tax=Candidatus Alistipes intestinigallinarum TaxID=2838440 RepID=A0A9D1YZ40_9BACT|nr:hypothetical protein [Candidatus Alistipes intestinigallinarum]